MLPLVRLTEAEARAKHPPNCPRCVWLGGVIGLIRCMRCALAAMAVSDAARDAER